ncbi:hypothetical protein V496_03080 [Pseudogymnoascus sp. VKM F-4515 (FW-2607)]|nr:hypothetical protein V496_03080 [Pseudogymnoascus sp. VKM F-4515 (FW-2607)]KFY86859.1 hypothetical protein V498_07372 [Pseudogymnoascus sp. VKM F-4517 (FW-2822)]
MSDQEITPKAEAVDAALGDMKLAEEDFVTEAKLATPPSNTDDNPQPSPTPTPKQSRSPTPEDMENKSETPTSEDEINTEVVEGDIVVVQEPGKAPKLSRKASQKVVFRPPPLFDHLEDATPECVTKFQVIQDCIYGSKYMGSADHEALGCDCSEDWRDGKNHACGEDTDCINRLTKIECMDDECNCGPNCQNQRFQRKEFSKVSVIKTEKKGYGLRADTDLAAHDFIFEYIGEVVNEPTLRRRMRQYDEEGIKHFYFMSLTKSEFVDATTKGNLGRFCNHSCNPNCYVDKWVVGDKLRMGIFAERNIKAGEELVFNYNVDRYGADPQPCYCAEPNCTGFLGGKTQTERATKLSHTTIEALGIDDGDGWDVAVAKKPRKKKSGEDDEEYVNNVQPKGLDENGVTKVMATLMQGTEKWIAVKLLTRIQRCGDERIRQKVVQFHGYRIMRICLETWKEDNNIILQVLDILYQLPRLTRNKIVDSKIEQVVEPLTKSEHEDIASESLRLMEVWSKLEVAYRIPRKKFDPTAQAANQFDARRGGDREEEPSHTPNPTAVAPTGPRNSATPRGPVRPFQSRPPMPRRAPLPTGWFATLDPAGNTYYYSRGGQTTWQRPTLPANDAPAPKKNIAKAIQDQKRLQDIIDSVTKGDQAKPVAAPKLSEAELKEKKRAEKWRSLPEEKQMKIYENTLSPHIKYVMDKYRKKLPKDDLKRFAKEIGKILTASDFKHKRVEDPTKITEYHEKKVKKSVRDYFEKAVAKRVAYEKKKAEKKAAEALKNGQTPASVVSNDIDTPATADTSTPLEADADAEDKAAISDVDMSDDELHGQSVPATPVGDSSGDDTLKRKRDEESQQTPAESDDAFAKRFKADGTPTDASFGPPPPPPPPPADAQVPEQIEEEDPAAAELRAAQEALERENEAAVREEEMQQAMAHEGGGTECKMGDGNTVNGAHDKSGKDAEGDSNGGEMEGLLQSERTEVLSH